MARSLAEALADELDRFLGSPVTYDRGVIARHLEPVAFAWMREALLSDAAIDAAARSLVEDLVGSGIGMNDAREVATSTNTAALGAISERTEA